MDTALQPCHHPKQPSQQLAPEPKPEPEPEGSVPVDDQTTRDSTDAPAIEPEKKQEDGYSQRLTAEAAARETTMPTETTEILIGVLVCLVVASLLYWLYIRGGDGGKDNADAIA